MSRILSRSFSTDNDRFPNLRVFSDSENPSFADNDVELQAPAEDSQCIRERYEYVWTALFTPVSQEDAFGSEVAEPFLASCTSRASNRTAFQTVDWTYDDAIHERDRMDMRNDRRKSCRKIFHSAEAWLFSFAFAVLTATTAAFITSASIVLETFRFGVCTDQDGVIHWSIPIATCCDGEQYVDWKEMTCETRAPLPKPEMKRLTFLPWNKIFGGPGSINFILYVTIGGTMATIAAVLVVCIQRKAKGSGIPEVKTILGGFVMHGVLGIMTLLVKSTALCFAVASGLSLGKEGPLVHVACCYANVLCRYAHKFSKNEAQKRTMLSAAAAVGVSVAFGAPIGGVLFSYEEVSSFFPMSTMVKSFFAAVVAAITLKYLDPTQTGKLTLFQVQDQSFSWATWEFLPFFALAVIGGLLGALFVRLNIKVQKWRKERIPQRAVDISEVTIIALLTLIPNYFVPFQRHASDLLLDSLFNECGPNDDAGALNLCKNDGTTGSYNDDINLVWWMLLAMALRMVQTIVTFGVNVPCGLFVPSLAVGALIGRAFAIVFRFFGYAVRPGMYAMIGAASVLGGVTRMTVSLVVIMFELTGAVNFIVIFMMAALVSKFVGDSLTKGIYDECIAMNNFPFLHMEKDITFDTRARDIMQTNLRCIYLDQDTTVKAVKQRLQRCHVYGMPLVTSEANMILHGFVRTKALLQCLQDIPDDSAACHFGPEERADSVCLASYVDRCYHQCVPETPLVTIFSLFRQLGLRYCLLTTYGKIEGIITKKDFLRHSDLLHLRS